jgi:hypothetical protein
MEGRFGGLRRRYLPDTIFTGHYSQSAFRSFSRGHGSAVLVRGKFAGRKLTYRRPSLCASSFCWRRMGLRVVGVVGRRFVEVAEKVEVARHGPASVC